MSPFSPGVPSELSDSGARSPAPFLFLSKVRIRELGFSSSSATAAGSVLAGFPTWWNTPWPRPASLFWPKSDARWSPVCSPVACFSPHLMTSLSPYCPSREAGPSLTFSRLHLVFILVPSDSSSVRVHVRHHPEPVQMSRGTCYLDNHP